MTTTAQESARPHFANHDPPLEVGEKVRWAGVFERRNAFTKDGVVAKSYVSSCFGPCVDVTFQWEDDDGGYVPHTTTLINDYCVERIDEKGGAE